MCAHNARTTMRPHSHAAHSMYTTTTTNNNSSSSSSTNRHEHRHWPYPLYSSSISPANMSCLKISSLLDELQLVCDSDDILPAPVRSAMDFIVDMIQILVPSMFLAGLDSGCPSDTSPDGLANSGDIDSGNSDRCSTEPGDTFGFEHCSSCLCCCACPSPPSTLSPSISESAKHWHTLAWQVQNISTFCLLLRSPSGNTTKSIPHDIVKETLSLASGAQSSSSSTPSSQHHHHHLLQKISPKGFRKVDSHIVSPAHTVLDATTAAPAAEDNNKDTSHAAVTAQSQNSSAAMSAATAAATAPIVTPTTTSLTLLPSIVSSSQEDVSTLQPSSIDEVYATNQYLLRRIRKLEITNQIIEDAYMEVKNMLLVEQHSKAEQKMALQSAFNRDLEELAEYYKQQAGKGQGGSRRLSISGSDNDFSDYDDSVAGGYNLKFDISVKSADGYRDAASVSSYSRRSASSNSSPVMRNAETGPSSPPVSVRRCASDSAFLPSTSNIVLPGDLGIEFLMGSHEDDDDDEEESETETESESDSDASVDVQFGHTEKDSIATGNSDAKSDEGWETEEEEEEDSEFFLADGVEFVATFPRDPLPANSSDEDADADTEDTGDEESDDDGYYDDTDHELEITIEQLHHPTTHSDADSYPEEEDGDGGAEGDVSVKFAHCSDYSSLEESDWAEQHASESDTDDIPTFASTKGPGPLSVRAIRAPLAPGAGSPVVESPGIDVDPVKAVIERYYSHPGTPDIAADIDDIEVCGDDDDDNAHSAGVPLHSSFEDSQAAADDDDFARRHAQRARETHRDAEPRIEAGPRANAGGSSSSIDEEATAREIERIATLPVDQRIAKFIFRASSHLLQCARGGLSLGFMLLNLESLSAKFEASHESVLCAFVESLYQVAETIDDNGELLPLPRTKSSYSSGSSSQFLPSALSRKAREETASPIQTAMRIVQLLHTLIAVPKDQDVVLHQLEQLCMANESVRAAKHGMILRILYESEVIDKGPIVQWYSLPEHGDASCGRLLRENASSLIEQLTSSSSSSCSLDEHHGRPAAGIASTCSAGVQAKASATALSPIANLAALVGRNASTDSLLPPSDENTTLHSQSSDSECSGKNGDSILNARRPHISKHSAPAPAAAAAATTTTAAGLRPAKRVSFVIG